MDLAKSRLHTRLLWGALAAAALFLALAVLSEFAIGRSWRRMEGYYPQANVRAGQQFRVQQFVLRDGESHSPVLISRFSQGFLSRNELLIELDPPFSWFYRPLQFPRTDVVQCSESNWSDGRQTNINLARGKAFISIADPDGNIFRWCSAETSVNP